LSDIFISHSILHFLKKKIARRRRRRRRGFWVLCLYARAIKREPGDLVMMRWRFFARGFIYESLFCRIFSLILFLYLKSIFNWSRLDRQCHIDTSKLSSIYMNCFKGQIVWPASILLSFFLHSMKNSLNEKSIIELGFMLSFSKTL
jgi:hypothetical protein